MSSALPPPYVTGVWALAQGIAALGPSLGTPEGATRWFLIAAAIGFPFWLAFAWFYELTPEGIRRESEVDADKSHPESYGAETRFPDHPACWPSRSCFS